MNEITNGNEENDQLRYVPLNQIEVNPYQPRRHFNEEEIQELGLSIQAVGLIHPPVVQYISEGKYELISGERRIRAAKWAGLQEIPVLIRYSNVIHSAKAALIENVQRVDLSAIEVALALRKLVDQFGYSQEELARQIGKKRSTVANYLRLLALPKKVQEGVSEGIISMGHAKVILSVETVDEKIALFDYIVKNNLTVREAEEVVLKKVKTEVKPEKEKPDANMQAIASEMQRKLGTRVQVQGKGKKGCITISYYNLDDLDRILALFDIKI